MQIEKSRFIGAVAFRKNPDGKVSFALEYNDDEKAYNFPRIRLDSQEKPLKELNSWVGEVFGNYSLVWGYKDFVELFIYENVREETTLFLFDVSGSDNTERARENNIEFFDYAKACHLLLLKEQKDVLERALSRIKAG